MDLGGLFELTESDTPSADTYLDPLLMLSVLGNLDFRCRLRLFVAHFGCQSLMVFVESKA